MPRVKAAKVSTSSPFGEAVIVSEAAPVSVGNGVKMDDMAPKTFGNDVHPEMRMNPEYHAVAVAEREERRQKQLSAMGVNLIPKPFLPSPNSPFQRIATLN